MHVPALVTSVAHLFGGMIQVLDAVEFSEVAVDSFEGGAHSQGAVEKG
jgi:hypothetical protein